MKRLIASILAAFRPRTRVPGDAPGTSARGDACSGSPTVRLLGAPGRSPATPFEQLVVAALRRHGAMPFRALAVHVARDLYLDELRKGAWAADIGLFGESLFVPEVAREVEAGNGRLWRIEAPALLVGAGAGDPSDGGPPCGEGSMNGPHAERR